ncbi:MAG TPA: aminoacyl-tRNA hydrolase [Acidimicrobiia bacterium]|nr:aminoacyl-tRNA hydrolase [Acidimicrobiia bacterium]
MLRRQRRGTPADVLVVGLGNPGKEYERTRHNVGADTVLLLARRHGAHLRPLKFQATSDEVSIDGHRVAFGIPLTYMNESGLALRRLVDRYDVEPEQLVVVHDELDLEPTVVRVKVGGGLAGHNGLRSIQQHLKTQDFLRVRIGIGKPPNPRQGANHVLDRFSKRERDEMDVAIEVAADAVETIVREGAEAAMTKFNARA